MNPTPNPAPPSAEELAHKLATEVSDWVSTENARIDEDDFVRHVAREAAALLTSYGDRRFREGAEKMRATLEEINLMACYASEEDTGAAAAMLLKIGEIARAAIRSK